MDYPFAYSKPATGKAFYGRKQDAKRICEALSGGENIAIYGAPKTGKTSLILESLSQLKLSKAQFKVAETDLLDVRESKVFLSRLCENVIRTFAATTEEYEDIIATCFTGTHVRFDPEACSSTGRIITLDGEPDKGDMAAMLTCPYTIAEERGVRLYIILKEFQNLRFITDWETLFKTMEAIMKRQREIGSQPLCSWIFTGSQLNAMKDIFEHTKYFFRLVKVMNPSPFEAKDITERILRGFLSSGKVVERAQIDRVCRTLGNNLWYINHFMSICDHLSKGYITEPVLQEAMDTMISLSLPRFCSIVNDLTDYQINLLRAVAEGQSRFSSADMIRRYGLSSSANVKRIKDALSKKEIVTFSDTDEASIIDPLFEFWVKKYFFRQEIDF